jgi:hypothetical protein
MGNDRKTVPARGDFGLAWHGIEGSPQRRKCRRFHQHINMIKAGHEFDREIRLHRL